MIGRMSKETNDPRAIKAVTFDLWQTLLLEDRDLGQRRAQLRIDGATEALRDAGHRFSQEHLWEAYRSCANACNAIRSRERDISFAEQVEIFIEQIRVGLSRELPQRAVKGIAEAYDQAFLRFPSPLHADAKATLAELKEKGYALGLISNTGMTPGATFRVYMERVGILSFFDTLVFSDEVRLAKPSEKVFHLALDALGVSPDMAVHVGDDRAKDVAGAKLAGLRAIWVPRPRESYHELDLVTPADGPPADVTVECLAEVVGALEELARHPV